MIARPLYAAARQHFANRVDGGFNFLRRFFIRTLQQPGKSRGIKSRRHRRHQPCAAQIWRERAQSLLSADQGKVRPLALTTRQILPSPFCYSSETYEKCRFFLARRLLG